MPSPDPNARKSIFVSHVNEDDDAEAVLAALNADLVSTLGQGYESYNIVYDRKDIGYGDDIHARIYDWLDECPAAIILISSKAFGSAKPWVALESFYLCVRRQLRRNLTVIPILIGNCERLFEDKQDFKPAKVHDIKRIRCSDPKDPRLLAEVVAQVSATLKNNLKLADVAVPEGLAGGIYRFLELHPEVLVPVAKSVKPNSPPANFEDLAASLIEADQGAIARAITTFKNSVNDPDQARKRKLITKFCKLIAAREVPAAAAIALAIEMAKAPEMKRGVILNSTDDDVAKLYLIRAACREDHEWLLLDCNSVLELGAEEQIRLELEEALVKGLASLQPERSKALSIAKGTASILHQAGIPAIFRLRVKTGQECRALVTAARATAPACGVLLHSDGIISIEDCPSEDLSRLEPQLNDAQENQLLFFDNALRLISEME